MIRHKLLGGAALLLMGATFFGREAVSYVRTSAGYITDGFHQAVPVEFQLQRARQMLKDVAPEVQKNMHLIAKEEVDLRRLTEQIAEAETRLGNDKEQMLKLKTELASGKASHRFGGRTYTVEQMRLDLARRFERYKTNDATLANLRQIHAAREQGLEAAQQKLEGMLAARRQLKVDIENLEARNQMVAAVETSSKYHFDDSRLGRLKELLLDLRTRLEVNERLVGAAGAASDEIPIEETAPVDIAERISTYFGAAAKPKADKGA